ncbi:BTAD domain-containing putative transcriptional regulator [Nucisporomicrobium flavum]|uniref:BTAD domain-containing putative transcriptional regulator n=1 Tax=Nucisporomicrobium flavum TaxID=2785915 RepID=UPI0018F5F72C|nr:BTAD domain-containing putative transcriptional regulator [Nucisporomicrobium flavum]
MRITTLGPLAVDGRPVRGERLAAVIRELAAARGRAVSAAALVDAVWDGDPPEDAAGAVQALVSRVRRLGLPVVAVAGGYRVPADQVETDVVAARALVDRGRAALGAGAVADARRAAEEARAFFPEVPELTGVEAARLFSDVAALRSEAALAGGGPYEEADLRLLAGRTPPDEPATALLVRVLAAQGRDAEALAVVDELRRELADRYGTDPSPVIADVHLALLRGELRPAAQSRPPSRAAMPRSWQRPGTPLVGRDGDVAAVEAALAEAPLVTIVATGGAGKTRLAAEVARRASGPVRVIELAGIRAPGEVLPAVVAALGGAETAVPAPALTLERRVLSPEDRLRVAAPELDGLVVLDNCEHVLDAAAAAVADLLAVAAPELTVLATSRAPLGLAGEAVHRLRTLPDGEAIRLLESRARAGGAVSTWDDAQALALCHRLDNLPLALELAAAKLRHMPVDDVLTGLDDRFTLLDDALRGLPERHASLWAMVDWSRELLKPADQELMQRLAVIPASFTADTAAAVAEVPDVRRGLAVLVEQSLLTLEDGEGGPPRYRMLETVREYGEARLGDRAEAMAGLVAWARNRSVELAAEQIGPRQLDVLAATAREQENLVAALRWAVDRDDEAAAVDVSASIFYLWQVRGLHVEVSGWGRTLLHTDDPVARMRSAVAGGHADGRALPNADRLAALCLMLGINAGITGPVRVAVLARRALRRVVAERSAEISPRYLALAAQLPRLDRFESQDALRGAEELIGHADPYVQALALFMRAVLRENGGMPEESLNDAKAAYARFEAVGDHWGMAMSAGAIGQSMTPQQEESVQWLRRGVEHMEMLGAAQDARSIRVVLDGQLAAAGDAEAERRLHETATSGHAEPEQVAQAYLSLAHLAWQRRDHDETLRCADAVMRTLGQFTQPVPQLRVLFEVTVAALYVTVAAERPVEGADARAAALLAQVRDEGLPLQDAQFAGGWALGGAALAAYRGDVDGAGELWAAARRIGAYDRMMFPSGDTGRLAVALGDEDHRKALLAAHADEQVTATVARIHELMARLLN